MRWAAICPTLIGADLAQETIHYTDQDLSGIWRRRAQVEGLGNERRASRRSARRAIQAGLKLVDCPIRHLGTEKAQDIYLAIEQLSAGKRRGDATLATSAAT